VKRLCHENCDLVPVSRPEKYMLCHAVGLPFTEPIDGDVNAHVCKHHDSSCIGHMELHANNLYLPSWMTPSADNNIHPLHSLKIQCKEGRCTYTRYKATVLSYLRGKHGYVRSMCRMTVQGSIKMVISPAPTSSESVVYIPRYVAKNCKVPVLVGESYHVKSLEDCTFGILVRQPCMWSGGIQPVRIVVTDKDREVGSWDTNSSMRIPISMCGPYGADFDGDEMTLFGVYSTKAQEECATFLWDHSRWTPYSDETNDYAYIVPNNQSVCRTRANTVAICTTLTWKDRLDGIKCTSVHAKWLTSVSSFISITRQHSNPVEFATAAMESMKIAASKSGSQSDVGAITRRTRLGSERVYLDRSGIPKYALSCHGTVCLNSCILSTKSTDGWFGNPAIRAVSKICSSIMQITLKVKSSIGVQNLSPTLSLVTGSKEWVIVYKDGRMDVHTMDSMIDYSNVDVVCSLYSISRAPEEYKHSLIQSFVSIVLSECRRSLDRAEYMCFYLLIERMVETPMNKPTGIQTYIGDDYREFSTLSVFSASYTDRKFVREYHGLKCPSTVVEYMMLRSFGSLPSITT